MNGSYVNVSGLRLPCDGFRDLVEVIRVGVSLTPPPLSNGLHVGHGLLSLIVRGRKENGHVMIWKKRVRLDAFLFDLCWHPSKDDFGEVCWHPSRDDFAEVKIGSQYDPREVTMQYMMASRESGHWLLTFDRPWRFSNFGMHDALFALGSLGLF